MAGEHVYDYGRYFKMIRLGPCVVCLPLLPGTLLLCSEKLAFQALGLCDLVGAGRAGVRLLVWSSLVKSALPIDDAFQVPPPHCVVPSPFCQVSLLPPWPQEVQRDPKAELT